MASVLDDSTHDRRVAAAMESAQQSDVSEAALRAATLVESDPSPAMLQDTARWLEVRDELAGAGLSPIEILRVGLRAATGVYGGRAPGVELLADMFRIPEGAAIAQALCNEVLGTGTAPADALQGCLCAALTRLAAAGNLAPTLLTGVDLGLATIPMVRVVLAALPLAQREAVVLERVAGAEPDSYRGARIVEEILALQDLAPTPAVLAARARALAVVEEEDGRTRWRSAAVPRSPRRRPSNCRPRARATPSPIGSTSARRTRRPRASVRWRRRAGRPRTWRSRHQSSRRSKRGPRPATRGGSPSRRK